MHINIAVVNASPIQQTRTKDALESYTRDDAVGLKIRYFLSGKDLLKDIELNGRYDVYIIDVVIPEMDGVTIAERLRASGDRGKIIFVNGDTTHAHKVFSVHASDYRLWPINKQDLKDALDWVIVEILEQIVSPVYCITYRGGLIRTRLTNIAYVEVINRVAYFHLTDGTVYSGKCLRGKFLEDMAELLEHGCMVSAGMSYIVNLDQIKLIDRKKGIQLWTGEIITPPRYKWPEVEKAWKEYM